MAGTIQAIDRGSVHKICSGQVVLNLATAVKELVENSLDAGATSIEVRLKEYGSESMDVIDNGCGVEEHNFMGLTLKHHTSKLQDFSDLMTVDTFGFRGEALSSLCALSQLTITTCHKDATVGAKLEYDHNGKLVQQVPCPRQRGTTVTVQQLFSTLPVRHKEFLRNLKKEFTKMAQVLYAYCIISTGVRITCTNQVGKGKKNVVVGTNGNATMKENITNVFGPKQLQSLLEFQQVAPSDDVCEDYNIKVPDSQIFQVAGFVSTIEHGQGRSSTDRQFIFINKRPCDLAKVSKVVNEVYHMYNRHQYPFLILDISLQKESVDVNVTPDKRQIFLENEKLLLAVIKTSLGKMFEPKASMYTVNQSPVGSLAAMFSRSDSSSPLRSPMKKTSSYPGTNSKKPVSSTLANLKRSFPSTFIKETTEPEEKQTSKQRKLDSFVMSVKCAEDVADCPSPTSRTSELCGSQGSVSTDSVTEWNSQQNSAESMVDTASESVISDVDVEQTSQESSEPCVQQETGRREYDRTNLNEASAQSPKPDRNLLFEQIKCEEFSRQQNNKTDRCEERTGEKSVESITICSEVSKESDPSGNGDQGSVPGRSRYQSEDINDVIVVERKSHSSGVEANTPLGNTESSGGGANTPPEGTDVTMTITQFDTAEHVKRRSMTVPFSMQQLQDRLKNMKMASHTKATSRSFRAKITPGDSQAAEAELQKAISKDSFPRMDIIGQFNLGFIIAKLDKDLFIIDQHATDEKYNFEMLQRHTIIQSQKLIQPQCLELTAVNEGILMDNIDIFHKNGFEFLIEEEALPTQRVKLVSMPISKNWTFGKEDIEELIFMLSDSPGVMCRPSRIRAMFASRACRKSIMIGTALNKAEMRKLLCHMAEIDQPWNCPHGRPTMRHIINLDMLPD